MHDALFSLADTLRVGRVPDLVEHVTGLEAERFRECLTSEGAANRLEEDRRWAERLGVNATPTLIAGGWVFRGLASSRSLTAALGDAPGGNPGARTPW